MHSDSRASLPVFIFAALLLIQAGASSQQSGGQTRDRQQAADRSLAEGRQVFESRCAACHGLDGRGAERAPDIATRPAVQRRSDLELAHIIKSGIPNTGMPGFTTLDDAAVATLVRYLRFLQGRTDAAKFPGSPENGKAIFFGKARCAECHMTRGQGGFIASDLSNYARTRSADEIGAAILKPSQEMRQGALVVVTGRDGQKYSGIIRNEDNFSLQLQSLDGGFHLLLRSEIGDLERRPTSLMPSDYGSRLNAAELNDLVSFLMFVANDGKPAAKKKPDEDDEDE